MHLFQQHAVKDFVAAAAQIPIVDYGPYFAGEPGRCNAWPSRCGMRARTLGSCMH